MKLAPITTARFADLARSMIARQSASERSVRMRSAPGIGNLPEGTDLMLSPLGEIKSGSPVDIIFAV